jgi:hypothetical protein
VRMRVGPGRAFLAVFRGLPEEVRPRVVLTGAGATRTRCASPTAASSSCPTPRAERRGRSGMRPEHPACAASWRGASADRTRPCRPGHGR